jgi:DNA end-binding protein Ku
LTFCAREGDSAAPMDRPGGPVGGGGGMPRAIWTGSLSFGLVNIPVRLYPATVERDVRFHQFQRGTGRRVRHQRVVPPGPPPEQWEPGSDRTAPPDESLRPVPSAPPEDALAEQVVAGAGSPAPPALPSTPPDRSEPNGVPEARGIPELLEPRETVDYTDVVKGYEIAPGEFVMVTPEELEALRPTVDRSIEIRDFVALSEIDPVYFDKSYYVAPQRSAEKPYTLLVKAMDRAGKVGIARFVLRTKEYLAAIRPVGPAAVLETLFYADEVRPASELYLPVDVEVSERELKVAGQLIGILATEWEPTRYRDTYRERLLELLESKATGRRVVIPQEEERPSAVPDLLAALRASVEAARKAEGETEGRSPAARERRRRTG